MTLIAQRTFTGGEVTPSVYPRVDVAKIATAVRTMRNFQIMRHGGARNRRAFQYLCPVKDHSTAVRVIPFIYGSSLTANFALEFGHQYVRFIENGYYPSLEAFQDIVSITSAAAGVFECTGHGYSNGDDVVLDGQTIPADLRSKWAAYRQFRVRNVTANTFTLEYRDGPDAGAALDTSAMNFGTYASGDLTVGRVLTLTSPYSSTDLFDLQYEQSGSTLTITHPSYRPRELTWDGVTWAINTISTAPSISAPTGLAASGAGGAGPARSYKVTAIADDTLEESLPTASVNATATNTLLSWNQVSGAIEYNVYGYGPAGWGLMAIVDETNRAAVGGWTIDATISPDITSKYPMTRDLFTSADDYPACVAYIKQRQAFASSNNDPEKVWLSRPGFYKNFSIRSPIQDDDAVTFLASSKRRNKVQHLLDLGKLVLLTETAIMKCEGGGDGVITPFAINPDAQSYFGAAKVKPVIIGEEALYVQARSAIVRRVGFNIDSDGYIGGDLSIFASHLFDDHTIIEMAYQEIPHSTLWAVRDDGVLLGLTYLREQQIAGWHRHDTDGTFESVCTVPINNTDALYAVVNRTINGSTVRYIEVMDNVSVGMDGLFSTTSLRLSDYADFLSTITLTGGSSWDENETLTATITTIGGGAAFDSSEALYKGFVIVHPTHGMVRLAIEARASDFEFTVRPDRAVPAAYQGVSTATVSSTAVYLSHKRITGLWHLEAESVAVVAGERAFSLNTDTLAYENIEKPVVIANPNNPAYGGLTVTDGVITLDDYVVSPRVGLPYLSDLETLGIDSARAPMADKNKLVTALILEVVEARGIWSGTSRPSDDSDDPTEGLYEAKIRNAEGYDEAIDALTGRVEIGVDGSWNENGRAFIRQLDPLDLTISAVEPKVAVAGGR